MDLFAAFYSLDLLLFLFSYREMSKVPREQTNKMNKTRRESLQNAIIVVFSAFISEFHWVAYIIYLIERCTLVQRRECRASRRYIRGDFLDNEDPI